MRIISPFRDYYDCISGMTYDKDDIVFHRKTEEIEKEVKLPKPKQGDTLSFTYNKYMFINMIIGFCGKLYYRFRVVNPEYAQSPQNDLLSFKIDEIDKFIKEKYKDKYYRQFCGEKPRFYRDRIWRDYTKNDLISFLSKPIEHSDVFDRYKCPIFSLQGRFGLTINPRLNELGFQHVFDPYQAYQEISMFLGNMAFPNKPIPTVSDEDMIQAKGFNKFSFRKDPKRE